MVVIGGCLSAACLAGLDSSIPRGSLSLAIPFKYIRPCSRHGLSLELRGGTADMDIRGPGNAANSYMAGLIDVAETAAVLPSAPIDSSAEGISYGTTTAAAVAANTAATYTTSPYAAPAPHASSQQTYQYASTQQSYAHASTRQTHEYASPQTTHTSGSTQETYEEAYANHMRKHASTYANAPASSASDPAPSNAGSAMRSAADRGSQGRPAVLASAVGLGTPSPRPQLGGDLTLLEETDQYLTEFSPALGTGDVKSVAQGVQMNRLYVQRCRSVLERTVDAFTRKQVESRIAVWCNRETERAREREWVRKKTRERAT